MTSLKSCPGTGLVGTVCQNPERDAGWDRDGTITIFLQNPGRNRDGMGQSQFFSYNFWLRTYFSCFRTSYLVLVGPFPLLESFFFCFLVSFGEVILSWDFCSCPWPRTQGQRDNEIFLSRPLETLFSRSSIIVSGRGTATVRNVTLQLKIEITNKRGRGNLCILCEYLNFRIQAIPSRYECKIIW